MRSIFFILSIHFFLVLASINYNCYGYSGYVPDTEPGLFDSEDLIQIELIANYDSILSDRGEDPSYHEGRIVYRDQLDSQHVVDCRVKTRGNFRKDPANCRFPPLLVNIKKKSARGTMFEGQNRLKIVTHCQTERYVFEEYMIYKMYNLVTDLSFRVRIAKITYINETGEKKKVMFSKYAFFIEEDESVARRFDGMLLDKIRHQAQIVRENMMTLTMFQYMIGNKDWFVTSRHNIKLLTIGQGEDLFAVPYDFDFSGIILASYTLPKNLPPNQIEERRVYKGLCLEDEEVTWLVDRFSELHEKFKEVYQEGMNNDYLSKGSAKRAIIYIDEFYKIINNPEETRTVFQERPNCLVPPPGLN